MPDRVNCPRFTLIPAAPKPGVPRACLFDGQVECLFSSGRGSLQPHMVYLTAYGFPSAQLT